jgi:osmoprotectant transport system permease protein
VGLFLGVYIAEHQKTSKPVLAVVNFIYTIPSISLLGFLIPLSGIGNTSAVIALTVYALLPMVRNTHTGVTHVDQSVSEAALIDGCTQLEVIARIKIPLALPMIIAGLRNMAVMTIALAGIASFIGAGGLGVAIYRGITTNNTVMTVDGSLLIALLALVVDGVLGLVEKALNKAWGDV